MSKTQIDTKNHEKNNRKKKSECIPFLFRETMFLKL